MVSTWSSGATLPPTNFRSMLDEDTTQEGLTFIDFLPQVQKPGGLLTLTKYETFRSLMVRANHWLGANPQWEIKTCESVEFHDTGNKMDLERMVYLENREYGNYFIRGLRLWIVRRKSTHGKGQQIGYINMVPQQAKKGGIFSSSVFENLDDVIKSFNTMIQTQPIPGRIITIESQEIRMKNKNEIDPDISSWMTGGIELERYLFIIRIFFEVCEAQYEEIGIKDFIPDMLDSGGVFSKPKYELFSNVLSKASDWCARQEDVRICNVQSLKIKTSKGKEIDTQRMNFSEVGVTLYVSILRVAYTKFPPQLKKASFSPTVRQLTCKTFVPVKLASGLVIPKYEKLQVMKLKISAWIKATGAQVISIQTTTIRVYGKSAKKYGSEVSVYQGGGGEEYRTWLFVIRVYMNGCYLDPPEQFLPPVPEMNCCVL